MNNSTFPPAQVKGVEKLLTVKEAAEVFGVSARVLRGWVHDRIIPFVRLPSPKGEGPIRFTPANIATFVRNKMTPSRRAS